MENYNFSYLIFDLVLTISLYMIFPLSFKLFHKEKIESNKAKKVAIINSVVLALFFIIFREILGVEGGNYNFAPAFFYYFINKIILELKERNRTPLFVLILICIGCFIVGLFFAYIIYWSISLLSLITVVIYLVRDKKQVNEEISSFECSRCGAEVEKDSMFCSKCGENFTGVYKIEEKEEPKKNEKIVADNLKVKINTKYCKYCGGKLNADKKCTKCGKQYFKLNKNILISLIIWVLVISNVVFILLYNDAKNEAKNISEACNDDSLCETELNTITGGYDLRYAKGKIDFYDENIVFVIEGAGNKYYTYDNAKNCLPGAGIVDYEDYIHGKDHPLKNGKYSYKVYNKSEAIRLGYTDGTC